MKNKPEFHGSDLEKIANYYHLDKEKIVLFGANVNPLGLSDQVKKDLADHLDIISSYPDRNYTGLKKAISEYTGTQPEHIVVGNGSTELISLLINQRAPKKALLLGPTYSEYARELNLVGGTLEYYNLKEPDHFQLDLPGLTATLESDIELLIICNPNNPTSSAISTDEMKQILSICKSLNIFVMIDETYIEFAPEDAVLSAIPLVSEFDNFMVIRGVSKFFAAPGLRLGYACTSNNKLLRYIIRHGNPWTINSVAAYAGTVMFTDTEYIERTRTLIQQEQSLICSALKSRKTIRVFEPSTNFVLLKIEKEGVDAPAAFEHCIRKGLMIRDCSNFLGLNSSYIRFCFLKPEDDDVLVNTLLEIL